MKDLFITVGKTIIKNWIKYAVILIALAAVVFFSIKAYNYVSELKDALKTSKMNELYYQGQLKSLRLTPRELSLGTDSISKDANKMLAENKIKPKQVKDITITDAVIFIQVHDTVPVHDDCSYSLDTMVNEYTHLEVHVKKDIVNNKMVGDHKVTVKDRIIIAKYYKYVYENQYKNKWVRFWHFDWRKVEVADLVVSNKNKAVEILDTKVIDIVDK